MALNMTFKKTGKNSENAVVGEPNPLGTLSPKGRVDELFAVSTQGFQVRLEPDPATYRTSSDAVQMALVTARALNVGVELELFEGTDVIRRIAAFDLFPQGEPVRPRTISRLATQRNPETGNNFLEVFIPDDAGIETVYAARDAAV